MQTMTPMHNIFMNRQLNIDDDELIEIRPDGNMGTFMGFGADDQGLFREHSRDSTCSFAIDQNFMGDGLNTINNSSLENVKDTTNVNSPTNNGRRINQQNNPVTN